MKDNSPIVVLAAAAHPDDIEFMMAGTLLLLKTTGAQIHLWNLTGGDCGSTRHSPEEIRRIRWEEARASAKKLDATIHPPLFDDFNIFYDRPSLARVAAVVREICPTIILTQSPQDYMEDHQNTTRLIVTAAFNRCAPNYITDPPRPSYDDPVALYHAMPHGLRDSLRHPIQPHFFVNITSVLSRKREMLAQHRSQKEWLDATQGMNAYLDEMEAMCRKVGKMSCRFDSAEGWRRHSHLGYGAEQFDPLKVLLAENIWEAQQ